MNLNMRKQSSFINYHLFGITLKSQHQFENNLGHSASTTNTFNLFFTFSDNPPVDIKTIDNKEVNISSVTGLKILKNKHWHIIDYPDYTTFFLSQDHIHCQLKDSDKQHLLEIRFLGMIISYWLSYFHHSLMLHSSAVANGNKALLFVAGNSSGKSSLSTTMIQYPDYLILSDDIVRIDTDAEQVRAFPSYPQMRLWPEQIKYFLQQEPDLYQHIHPSYDKRRVTLPRKQFGDLSKHSCSDIVIYLPNKCCDDSDVKFSPISHRDAFFLIKSNLFTRDVLPNDLNQKILLHKISFLTEQARFFRIDFPDGYDKLPKVCEQIKAHAELI